MFHQHIITAQDAHHAFMAALHINYATVLTTSAYLEKTGIREASYA
jgi:hypothetical protein